MDEQRESLVKPLLIDKVKVCDYDISSVTIQKLLQAGICNTRDLRVRTPYEIRQEAQLSLFQYLRLFQYLHNNGVSVYEKSEDKLTQSSHKQLSLKHLLDKDFKSYLPLIMQQLTFSPAYDSLWIQ